MNTVTYQIEEIDAKETDAAITYAADVLRRGGLVVFPTETVYGLGGNALDPAASAKIYAAKGRPSDNPLIIHIADPKDAEAYTYTDPLYDSLAEHFMPGPLTVIMEARDNVPREVRAGLPTVAVRCPAHPLANRLIRAAGVPSAAPSANLSGKPSPTEGRHVRADMDGRVDVILDGGAASIGVESTIVKIEKDGGLLLLRPGGITVDDLRAVCPDIRVADAVTGALKEGQTVLSPGMKYRHYAPDAPLFLLDGDTEARIAYVKNAKGRVAVLSYREELPLLSDRDDLILLDVGGRQDTATQAHRLFSLLRDADALSPDVIFAPLPSMEGMGLALYNRMIRAAAHQILKL